MRGCGQDIKDQTRSRRLGRCQQFRRQHRQIAVAPGQIARLGSSAQPCCDIGRLIGTRCGFGGGQKRQQDLRLGVFGCDRRKRGDTRRTIRPIERRQQRIAESLRCRAVLCAGIFEPSSHGHDADHHQNGKPAPTAKQREKSITADLFGHLIDKTVGIRHLPPATPITPMRAAS